MNQSINQSFIIPTEDQRYDTCTVLYGIIVVKQLPTQLKVICSATAFFDVLIEVAQMFEAGGHNMTPLLSTLKLGQKHGTAR